MFKKVSAACFALFMTAFPAAADVFICQFKTSGDSVVQEVMAFGLQPDGQSAIAFDAFIDYVNGAPANAVLEASEKKLSLVWSLKAKGGSQQWARLNYRLAFFKETNRATIRIKPAGYANEFTARGACQKSKMTMAQLRRAQRG